MESLVRLNLSGMVGSSLLRRLRERFELASLHRVSQHDLERVPGIGPVTAAAIAGVRDEGGEIELARARGIKIIPCTSPEFPAPLRSLYDFPIVLYRRGTYTEADHLAVGIVGSRQCTEYGRRQAGRFGQGLAGVGVTVVSGLARGIDTAAHRGALRTERGRTLAVTGNGLLRVYPRENARLMSEICERGAIFSEFPLEAGPEPTRFPRRNRIISGLSLGVLVVEAAERSGALITTEWALEQGREVFCLPGSVESPLSRGCHALIRQGAHLVEGPADLLEEVPALAPLIEPRIDLTPLQRAVLRQLGRKPLSTEMIAAASRLPLSSVTHALDFLVRTNLAMCRINLFTSTPNATIQPG